jgi:pimeloyl-ACP methyl ester carboxylesterase
LADHLAIDKFSVMGVSGGGPHALACAALLSDRVVRAGVVSGAGPLSNPGLAEGLSAGTRLTVQLAQSRFLPLHVFTSAEIAVSRRFPRFAMNMLRRSLPAPDAELMARPEIESLFQMEIVQSPRTAGRAMAQDLALFGADWGFDLASIAVPVIFWQGDLDKAVPFEHAQFMHAATPGSVLHELPGNGHMYVINLLESVLRELVP